MFNVGIGWIRNRYRDTCEWGVHDDTPPGTAKCLRISNGVFQLFLAASFVETLACFLVADLYAASINFIATLTFSIALLLMKSGHTRMARYLVMTAGNIGTFFMAMAIGPDAQFQLVLICSSALSFLFFPPEDWGSIAYCLLLSFATYLALEFTDYAPLLGHRVVLSAHALKGLRVVTVGLVWCLLTGAFIGFVRTNRRSQERLVHSARLAALGQMAAGMSHEVNNPLTGIVGHAERLGSLSDSGAVSLQEATLISSSITRLSLKIGAIVHGLQHFSRDSDTDAVDRVPLSALVEMTLDFCRGRAQSKNIELRVKPIPVEWTVLVRESQIAQVLLNLLNNSVDALDQCKERWIEISAQTGPAAIDLIVMDSGNGIDPEIRRKMFEPFFTTRPHGSNTGLGLSVARGIMLGHQGQIYYDDRSAKTRFVLRIPTA